MNWGIARFPLFRVVVRLEWTDVRKAHGTFLAQRKVPSVVYLFLSGVLIASYKHQLCWNRRKFYSKLPNWLPECPVAGDSAPNHVIEWSRDTATRSDTAHTTSSACSSRYCPVCQWEESSASWQSSGRELRHWAANRMAGVWPLHYCNIHILWSFPHLECPYLVHKSEVPYVFSKCFLHRALIHLKSWKTYNIESGINQVYRKRKKCVFWIHRHLKRKSSHERVLFSQPVMKSFRKHLLRFSV